MTTLTVVSKPNYFASAEVAKRYRLARPFFHSEAAARISELSGVARFYRALDVGCGAGHSTIALTQIADEVIGIDASPEMLEVAPVGAGISYRIGQAEKLEFSDGEFDLVTVALALHWFDQQRFFAECRRVLAPGGILAVYNDHFTAHMHGDQTCKHWMRGSFAKRFPQPARGMRDVDEVTATECGLRIMRKDYFEHIAEYSRAEFIAYLLTRSHTLAPIQAGKETQSAVEAWLDGELQAILPDGATGEFIFKCNLWLMKAEAEA